MKDRILIEELEVFYRVGVPDSERAKPQRLLIGVVMELDLAAAAAADDLATTIDYAAVSRRLLGLGEGREWRLIETVAMEIAGLILAEFGPERVEIEVRKFIVPEARSVAVRISRARDSLQKLSAAKPEPKSRALQSLTGTVEDWVRRPESGA